MINKSFAILIITIALFIILAGIYESPLMSAFDTAITVWIVDIFPSSLQRFFIFTTTVGSIHVTLPLLFFIAFLSLLKRKYLLFLLFIMNFKGVRFFNEWLKLHFERERPPLESHLVSVTSYSFPSGHSMKSLAFYGILCWYLLQSPIFQTKQRKLGVLLFFSVLILFIGISRIYLRVHFPTDVIGGFLAGVAWLSALVITYERLRKCKKLDQD
jgi:undecaprenyl-diphosphatase